MAIAWSRISSKVIAHPHETDAVWRRRYGNGHGRSGPFIPHMVDRRKQEVLGTRDAAVMPSAQPRGGGVSNALGQTASSRDPHGARSTPCPHVNEMPTNRPKPDSVAAAQHRSASHGITARRSRLPRLWSRP